MLKHPNSLGKAINDAWKLSSPQAVWLIALSNDMFCMKKWLENFKLVVQSNLKPDYVFAALRMPGFLKRVSHKTINGGSFVIKSGKWKMGYPFGGGLAVKRKLVLKHRITFIENHRLFLKRSIYADVCRQLYRSRLRWIELGKPCLLFQDCEFGNPLYKAYYKTRFKIHAENVDPDYDYRVRKFANLKRTGYTTNPDLYYEGSGYKISTFYRDALKRLKSK